jgi:hypothetical protein
MMKQPFTKFGVTTLFSLLCSAFLHAQVVTDERMFSFEEPQIPDCITATHSRLCRYLICIIKMENIRWNGHLNRVVYWNSRKT